MILGIGEDISDIRRIDAAYKRFGQRFLDRVFTPLEQAKALSRHGVHEPAATLAKRFAAKEACAKALGTGFNKGVTLKSIGVINAPGGKPTLDLRDGAARRLQALTATGTRTIIHVTLTDEYPLAKATVIIEAVADDTHKG